MCCLLIVGALLAIAHQAEAAGYSTVQLHLLDSNDANLDRRTSNVAVSVLGLNQGKGPPAPKC